MITKINGRTPEEIKKGLECCADYGNCTTQGCPYYLIRDCGHDLYSDALAYIQQLERERDAAVEDIREAAKTGSLCYTCTHNRKGHCKAFDHGIFEATVMCGQYEWRGAQEVNENGKESS